MHIYTDGYLLSEVWYLLLLLFLCHFLISRVFMVAIFVTFFSLIFTGRIVCIYFITDYLTKLLIVFVDWEHGLCKSCCMILYITPVILTRCPWASYSVSLYLSFFIYKMRIKVHASWVVIRIEWINVCKTFKRPDSKY